MNMILFPLIPEDDFPEHWTWTPDEGDPTTMADELSGIGMSSLDLLARDYGHGDNWESDEQGAYASWHRLTDGQMVAYSLACGDRDSVKRYAYVRSDDHGFWDIKFSDSEHEVRNWLAMWTDQNVPPSDEDLSEDGETVLVEHAKDWEGWDEFLTGYVTCAFWASHVDDSDDIDKYDADNLSYEAWQKMEDDCASFMFHNYAKLQRVGTMAQHGHDFWLTRNRHGAGFWDRGYGDLGEDLSDKARAFGECELYISDEGKVEVQ